MQPVRKIGTGYEPPFPIPRELQALSSNAVKHLAFHTTMGTPSDAAFLHEGRNKAWMDIVFETFYIAKPYAALQ